MPIFEPRGYIVVVEIVSWLGQLKILPCELDAVGLGLVAVLLLLEYQLLLSLLQLLQLSMVG